MPYLIIYSPRAERELGAIRDKRMLVPLRKALDRLAENPRPPGVKKLKGVQDQWRIRVGDWRIVYVIEDGRLVVVVVAVGVRGGVYG